jgi:tetratricopeptide (TPR) repeat protein
MPSLSALNEFKNSFNDIADEKSDVTGKGLPFDEFALPLTEAPPFEPLKRDTMFNNSGSSESYDDIFDESPAETDTGGDGNFDFSAFLDSLSGSDTPAVANNEPPSLDDLFSNVIPPPSSDDELPSIDDLFQDESAPMPEDNMPEDNMSFTDEAQFPDDMSLPDESLPEDNFSVPDGLLSGLSEEIESLPEDNFSVPDDLLSGFSDEIESTPEDNFSVPDDLLSGLSDEIESSPADFPANDNNNGNNNNEEKGFNLGGERRDGTLTTEIIETPSDEAPLPSFDEMPSFDEGASSFDEMPSFDEGASSFDEMPSFDEGASSFDEMPSFDEGASSFDEMPSFDEGASSFDEGSSSEEPFDFDNESFPDFGAENTSSGEGIDLGGETQDFDTDGEMPQDGFSEDNLVLDDIMPDADFGSDNPLAGFELPEDNFSESPAEGESPLPDFDEGFSEMDLTPGADDDGLPGMEDFGSDFSSDSIELERGAAEQSQEVFGDDEFSLPALDDIFEKNKIAPLSAPKHKKGFFGRRKKEEHDELELPEAEDDIEEIQLSQDELDKLMATLKAYPLNLRIACEELIAEQVILPQQLSKLIRCLVRGAHVKETAQLAGEILGKEIIIPRSFEKGTGEAWEEEKASFAYIFVHNFLPVLRLFAVIAALIASLIYLGYTFIYIPIRAEGLYQRGYERIHAGEFQRANELFHEAFILHRKKNWFYRYAEAFRDQRRFMLAEAKYEELLRFYPRDKKGVLDYARLQTYYLMNYDKANRILQQHLLDFSPNDFHGLLAAGDNFLAWADSDPSRFYDRYEDARFAYARVLQLYGWTPPVVERMMIYFIRTDNLREVLPLRHWFDGSRDRRLSPSSLAELGGYLLDKQLEEVRGVPNPWVENIESVRAMLIQAVREDVNLPEPHYHLARYYHSLNNIHEERITLENAIRAFDLAETETVRRRLFRVDAHQRYANLLINNREFFPAEEHVVRGIQLYEDFMSRNLIRPSVQLGRLYSTRGDLEYFVKTSNMRTALNYYHIAERHGWAPPENHYRMGAAYYQLEDWGRALDYLSRASAELPLNRRLLYALGNVSFQRGNFFAAQGYYSRLLDILENQRNRLPVLLPNDHPEFLELGERLMMARNNAGVVYESLAEQTGNLEFRARALSLYAESARAWDSITRNPQTMVRMSLVDVPGAPGVNLGFLNAANAMRPAADYRPQVFVRIDRDVLEPSRWEELAPLGGLLQ